MSIFLSTEKVKHERETCQGPKKEASGSTKNAHLILLEVDSDAPPLVKTFLPLEDGCYARCDNTPHIKFRHYRREIPHCDVNALEVALAWCGERGGRRYTLSPQGDICPEQLAQLRRNGRKIKRRQAGKGGLIAKANNTLLVIDVDGVHIDGANIYQAPQQAARAVRERIAHITGEDAWRQSTCVWEISGTGGLKKTNKQYQLGGQPLPVYEKDPTTVKLHLWFFVDKPVTPHEVAGCINRVRAADLANGGEGKIADHMARVENQPVYGPPCFQGCEDPIPQRRGILLGTLPALPVETVTGPALPIESKTKTPRVLHARPSKPTKTKPRANHGETKVRATTTTDNGQRLKRVFVESVFRNNIQQMRTATDGRYGKNFKCAAELANIEAAARDCGCPDNAVARLLGFEGILELIDALKVAAIQGGHSKAAERVEQGWEQGLSEIYKNKWKYDALEPIPAPTPLRKTYKPEEVGRLLEQTLTPSLLKPSLSFLAQYPTGAGKTYHLKRLCNEHSVQRPNALRAIVTRDRTAA